MASELVDGIATKLASAQSVIRSTFDQVEQLIRLLLTIPCSSAEAERSFSSLRRLKNILAQLNESAATQSPGCSACTQGQTIQH